ncbi:MAG: sulfotransferase [Chloroflexi bacterium]|nr:sulfotransferase [Chloroflexota bacterium]
MGLLNRVRRSLSGKRPKPATRSTAWILEEQPPPACPPGWSVGPPDFVVVGAQKAGTTWWFRLIAAHPQVHQDDEQRPELHFFDRYHSGWPTPDDIERYHRLFPRPPGSLTGEKTPEYMADYWVPEMLREAAPEARLIVLLRDPIERYRSAITHGSLRDWPKERRTESDSFHRGMYGPQLERLRDSFDPARILVLQYERCVIDPAGQLARTLRFLGLPHHELAEEELREPRNRTRVEKVDIPAPRLALLRRLYERDVQTVSDVVVDLDVSLWPNFAHLAAPAEPPRPAASSTGDLL